MPLSFRELLPSYFFADDGHQRSILPVPIIELATTEQCGPNDVKIVRGYGAEGDPRHVVHVGLGSLLDIEPVTPAAEHGHSGSEGHAGEFRFGA